MVSNPKFVCFSVSQTILSFTFQFDLQLAYPYGIFSYFCNFVCSQFILSKLVQEAPGPDLQSLVSPAKSFAPPPPLSIRVVGGYSPSKTGHGVILRKVLLSSTCQYSIYWYFSSLFTFYTQNYDSAELVINNNDSV